MAATDAHPVPIKGVAYRLYLWAFNATGDPLTGAAAPDSEISKDGAAFADCTNEVTEVAQGQYYIDLTATEMGADHIGYVLKSSTTGFKQVCIDIYPSKTPLDGFIDLGTAQAGASTTITLQSGASAVDSAYNGLVVVILAGTGVGQTRRITGYVGSTKVATVATAWTTTPDTTSSYVLVGGT